MGRSAYGVKRNENMDDDDNNNNYYYYYYYYYYYLRFAEVRTNRLRCRLTPTDQSDERFP